MASEEREMSAIDEKALEAAARVIAIETDRDSDDYYARKLARTAITAYLTATSSAAGGWHEYRATLSCDNGEPWPREEDLNPAGVGLENWLKGAFAAGQAAATARIARLEKLIPLAKLGDAVMDSWPEGYIDGGDLQDMLKDFGLIAAVEGGFNENIHIDDHNCFPEPGDEWLVPTQAAIDARAALGSDAV